MDRVEGAVLRRWEGESGLFGIGCMWLGLRGLFGVGGVGLCKIRVGWGR